jgi:hypothetical protein
VPTISRDEKRLKNTMVKMMKRECENGFFGVKKKASWTCGITILIINQLE